MTSPFSSGRCFVEPRLKRPVEAQEDVPAFAGNGLHPIVLMATRSLWAEPDIDRLVVINLESLCLAADAGILLVGLEHRAGLIVVEQQGPEILDGYVGRQVQLVSLASGRGGSSLASTNAAAYCEPRPTIFSVMAGVSASMPPCGVLWRPQWQS